MTHQLKFALVFSIFLGFIACNSAEDQDSGLGEITPFVSESIFIDESYPEIDSVALDVMDRMQICTLSDTVMTLPPCSNEFFRVFQYRSEKEWKDGFMVEMIPGLYGSPVHQLVIIENQMGKYRIVNQYLGTLFEMRTTIDGYHDLLIGYSDPDVGLVTIRHEWQGQKYDVVDVEEINNHFVKPEMKDSINALFLTAFSGGH